MFFGLIVAEFSLTAAGVVAISAWSLKDAWPRHTFGAGERAATVYGLKNNFSFCVILYSTAFQHWFLDADT